VAEWDQTLAVNLRGPMLCCREGLPRLADGASIVFVSSIAGLRAGSQLVSYDASKAALGGLMRHVALEGSRRGIRANVVCPGLVDTPLGRIASAGRPSRTSTPIPFGRQATGWEIAYAVLFFISDESVYVTGQTRALARAIRELRRDGGVRVLVVTGAGDKAFSAGADIAAMAAMSAADGHAYSRLGHEVLARLEALAIPVVAAVNGVALGGGLELALACDLIVASEKARLGQPEINLGLIPGFGGTQRLVRRIGQTRARELIYLGHMVAAEEALRLGLVNRVVPHERLAEEAAKLAAELAAKAPVALAQAKRATAIAADADLETGCRFEVEAFGVTFA